ncbi:MAG: hypothetical protein EBR82_65625 [Caulobacteraceae bacterium]|nr:hypothetical protein [Caulobacteraceae bacterium]
MAGHILLGQEVLAGIQQPLQIKAVERMEKQIAMPMVIQELIIQAVVAVVAVPFLAIQHRI